jgi:hypothetical protein
MRLGAALLMLSACNIAALTGSGDPEGRSNGDGSEGDGGPSGADATKRTFGITQAAYFADGTTPRMRIAGYDPAGALEAIRIEFLDDAENPTDADTNGDGVPDAPHVDVQATADTETKRFLLDITSAPSFERKVPVVAATPFRKDGTAGARIVARFGPLPVRQAGDACDALGFDRCEDSVCAQAEPNSAARCAPLADARRSRCALAPQVDADTLPRTVVSATAPTSLWDPEVGCAMPEAVRRPDGVIRLRVTAPIASLKVSTDTPETGFDTVLSVLRGCDGEPVTSLACNDDDEAAPRSSVTLRDVAPGDYVIVVDAVQPHGGTFGVRLEAR